MAGKLQLSRGRLTTLGQQRTLFVLCWLAYASTYLGRLNYAACLVAISHTQGWDKGEAGLVATALFAAYGVGQLVNGVIGDRMSPRYLVSCGLACSGLVNLLFPLASAPATAAGLWALNGFAQSMIWSPLIRLISEWMPKEKRLQTCVNMNTTTPVGTLTVYLLSASLVGMGNWKLVFLTGGAVMLAVAALFLVGIGRLDTLVQPTQETEVVLKNTGEEHLPIARLMGMTAAPMICIAALMQGMLKDGVTTWIPTFLEEEHALSAAGAILRTSLVPLISLGGVYLASWLNQRVFRNEIKGSGCFFVVGLLALGGMILTPGRPASASLILLVITITAMMGINGLIVGMMPSYYVHYGVCSTFSGIFNSAVYAGAALSSWLNGAMVDRYGWDLMGFCWFIYAVVGLVACVLSIKKWQAFRANTT